MNNPTDEERYHADPMVEQPGDEARHLAELFGHLRYGGENTDAAGPGEQDYQPGTVLYTWKPELFATLKPYFNLSPPRLQGEAAERSEQIHYSRSPEPLSDDMKIQLLDDTDWIPHY